MANTTKFLSRSGKKIRKTIRKNPYKFAALLAASGMAAVAARKPGVAARSRELKQALMRRLSPHNGGISEHNSLAAESHG
ncbi:MAG TPA: hypothetical protein VER33_21340 [Polyangiaceae bacterium]|nr:hypothetical protein [Polyangiaceae bacterium]